MVGGVSGVRMRGGPSHTEHTMTGGMYTTNSAPHHDVHKEGTQMPGPPADTHVHTLPAAVALATVALARVIHSCWTSSAAALPCATAEAGPPL